MAGTPKLLAQQDMPYNTLTDVYTVPSGHSAVITQVRLTSSEDDNSRSSLMKIAQAGGADNNKHFIMNSRPTRARQANILHGPIPLAATDVIRLLTNCGFSGGTTLAIAQVYGYDYSPADPSHKILGQSVPGVNTLTTLYTVPALKKATITLLNIASFSSGRQIFRVAIDPLGAGDTHPDYLFYDAVIHINQVISGVLALPVQAGGIVRIQTNGNVAFNLFGLEEDA